VLPAPIASCAAFDRFSPLAAFSGGSLFFPFACATAAARGALAAAGLNEHLGIIFAVIDGDFLAELNLARSDVIDAPLGAAADHRFGIRPAGMVDVAANIAARGAIDAPLLVDLEQVFVAPVTLKLVRRLC
jgi:hypothetical protein